MTDETLYYLRSYAPLFLAAVIGATPLPKNAAGKLCSGRRSRKFMAVLEPLFLLLILIVCTAYLVDGSFNPFLYFRF